MLSCKATNELIQLVQEFKKSKDCNIAEQIVKIYDSLPNKSKVLGNNRYIVAGIVYRFKNGLYKLQKNQKINDPAGKILSMISSYRRFKSRSIAENILNYYDSIDNRKKTFGKDFHKIQVFISRLRKKFSITVNTNNEIKRKILALMEEFKKNRNSDTARKICKIYDSITDSKSKILGQDYGRIKLYVWNLKRKFLSDSLEQINKIEKEERERFSSLTSEKISALSPGRTSAVINLSYRIQKFQIRKYLLELLKGKRSVQVLTLPGTEWIFERDLLIQCQNDCIIVGLENDKTVYQYGRLNMPPTEATVYYFNMSDKKFFSKEKHPFGFDLIWLDYMGPFTRQRLEVFELACKNGYLKKDCIIALTFMCGREFKDIQEEYRKNCKVTDNFHEARKRVIPEMYVKVAQKYGYRATIKKVEIYREQQGNCKCVPMIFIAIQLIKN